MPDFLRYFVHEYNKMLGKSIQGFSDRAMQILTSYSWSGNVRQLKNIVERMMVLADGDIIDADMLPQEILGRPKHRLTASSKRAVSAGRI